MYPRLGLLMLITVAALTLLGHNTPPVAAERAAGVTGGLAHTCALTTAGGVKCWGSNNQGQLGDGTTTQRLTPVDVSGLTSGVAAVAAGMYHTCAVTAAGGLKCWGYNLKGQVGDGTTGQRLTPVDVSGLTSGVAAVAAGQEFTCAVTTSGGVKCWGLNAYGQLGDGTSGAYRLEPVDVSGLTSGVASVAPGNDHTCALTTTGGVKCWGENDHGQLGDGTTTRRLTPVDVSGLTSGVAAVAAGTEHTCAVMTTGGVKCWGANWAGQLGDGTKTGPETCADNSACSTTPLDVIGFAPSVGGIAELPDMAGSPPHNYAIAAVLAFVALLAFAAGGWYARRRWLG